MPDPRTALHWTSLDWSSLVRDVTLAGRGMRYVDMGEADGPPIVLVHGTGGSWQSWLLNLVDLSRHHRVIAVDLPGFGMSDAFDSPAGMEDYADAVAALLDTLGIERAIAVGHSLGGIVVLRMALRYPSVVAGLVNVNGGGVTLSELRLRLVIACLLGANTLLSHEPVARAVIRRPRPRRWLVAAAMHDRDALTGELAAEMLAVFAAPGLVEAVAAGARDDIADHVHEIECPALLLWGRRDRLVPLPLAHGLAERMQHARVRVIDGAGHCPMIERPAAFNDAVRSFATAVEQGWLNDR